MGQLHKLKDGTGRDEIRWDETGRDKMGWNREEAKMPSDGNKEEEEGDGEIIILCSRRVRWNENSPKIRPVEHHVPPVLGAPNVRRNASSRSVPSRPTYQTVPEGTITSSILLLNLNP
ncbi:hypothetical protein DVH24_038439 [Malus domestica]|uniref:Uncharacterized protein n=1 Tax=Malus domestica TaxID=3750 RepID=A0A498KEI5_MALDO|nr:hypothetical protein DVH24_038439 [Malus domestica]